jgi:hypothetical protein
VKERHKRAAPGNSLALLLSPANATLTRSEQKPGGREYAVKKHMKNSFSENKFD